MQWVKTFLLTAGIISSIAAENGEWPQFRGPRSNGSVEVGEYPTKFSPETAVWKVKLPGKGTSTPIVSKNRIFVTSPTEDGQDALIAFDVVGKQVWQTKLGAASAPKHKQLASSCNASPVADGETVYVYFRSGNFAALGFDGKVKWQKNLVEEFGADKLFWDQATSPVLTDKFVVLARMHAGESWIAGFDKKTGEMKWRELRNYKTPNENDQGYTTPIVFDNAGTKALLVWGAEHLTAHDAENGKLIWEAGNFNPKGTGFWPAISSPVIAGNIAVIPVGRDDRAGQSAMFGIKLGGKGDVSESHRIWGREDIGIFVTSPVEYKGRVYLLRNKGQIVCLDPSNGKSIWVAQLPEHRSPYYASPVIANGVLFAAREDGMVFAARVGEQFELLGENNLGERIIATPTPAGGRLLIRGDEHLFCFAANRHL